jgi:hypothetical protein
MSSCDHSGVFSDVGGTSLMTTSLLVIGAGLAAEISGPAGSNRHSRALEGWATGEEHCWKGYVFAVRAHPLSLAQMALCAFSLRFIAGDGLKTSSSHGSNPTAIGQGEIQSTQW